MTLSGGAAGKASARAIFSLYNLGCSSCSVVIERKLGKMSGIRDVAVNYVTDTVLVDFDPSLLTAEEVRGMIKKLGYDALEKKPGTRL